MLGSNIARINSMEELLTVPEREEAERFLSIPLNISVVASAIVDASVKCYNKVVTEVANKI